MLLNDRTSLAFVILLAPVLSVGGCTPSTSGGGTGGWLRWDSSGGGNNHLYRINRDRTDWESAQRAAKTQGAHLVTINSAEEEAFITANFLQGDDRLSAFWIGATDREVERTFMWVTGEPFSYTHWKSGEPNGWDGPEEDYVCINWNAVRGPIGEWNDTLIAGSKGYDNGANDGPYASIEEKP